MPGGDRSGPMGRGSMSGRAAGYCAGYDTPGYAQPGPGYGAGMGFGRGRGMGGRRFAQGGRGWRHGFHATGQPRWARFGGVGVQAVPAIRDEERRALRRQADALASQLDSIRRRLAEMEGESPAE